MGKFCFIIFIYMFLILNVVCWEGEKHGIVYFATIIVLSIMFVALSVAILFLVQSLILLICTLITDGSPIWFL